MLFIDLILMLELYVLVVYIPWLMRVKQNNFAFFTPCLGGLHLVLGCIWFPSWMFMASILDA